MPVNLVPNILSTALELLILDQVINELRTVIDHLDKSLTYFERVPGLPAPDQKRLDSQYQALYDHVEELKARLRPSAPAPVRRGFGFQVP